MRRRDHNATRHAPNAPPVSSTWIAPPNLVANVMSVRNGTESTIRSSVNMPVDWTTLPSGRTTALTPLIAATTTARPCSMARSRAIASCW